MVKDGGYREVYSLVRTLGGKCWAYYGYSVLYIKENKLFLYRLDGRYSITVTDSWCRNWLNRKREVSKEKIPVVP